MAKHTSYQDVLRGHIPDLGQAALVVSGTRDARVVTRYLRRLDDWLESAIVAPCPTGEAQARLVFQELWRQKPQRYQPGGSFRLTEVIDAQMGPGLGPVGNCLGLTLLYNALLERWGMDVGAVYLPHAFRGGPHAFSLVLTPGGSVDVENILPDGFDYAGHRDAVGRTTWGNRELIAEVLAAEGNELFEAQRLQEAVEKYRAAIELNPRHPSAHLNLGMTLSQLGRLSEAEEAFEEAT